MNNWQRVKLCDVISKIIDNRGKNPPYFTEKGIPCIDNFLISAKKNIEIDNAKRFIDNYLFENFIRNKLKVGDLIITLVGNGYGNIAVINNENCVIVQNTIGLRVNEFNDYNFLYYVLRLKNKNIKLLDRGAAQPSIKISDLLNIEINLPLLEEQKAIAGVLSAFDDKIELNNKIIKNLEEQAQTLYKHWFIDYVGEKEETMLGNFFPVITGKKNANSACENGIYPFFSCSQDALKTNDYSFDDSAILVAGNGDFNVKFYKGKFDAYQRTYVLIPYNKKLLGVLYYIVKNSLDSITAGFRGSVIKFITKGNIESFKIEIPKNLQNSEIVDLFNNRVDKILNLEQENEKLAEMRDYLLPKLMSGKIRVEYLTQPISLFGKEYFENTAKLILNDLYNLDLISREDRYGEDRPDLISFDESVGVEVTRAISEIEGKNTRLFEQVYTIQNEVDKINNKAKKIGIDKNLKIKKGTAFLNTDNESELKISAFISKINEKVSKLNEIDWHIYKNNYLFVFCKLSHYEIENCIDKLNKDKINYDKIFIFNSDNLFVLENNKLKLVKKFSDAEIGTLRLLSCNYEMNKKGI